MSLALSAFGQSSSIFSGMGMPQQASAPVAPAASSNVQQNLSPVPQGAFESNTLDKNIDKVFDVKTDSFDTDSGNINWKGKNFNIGDSKIMRARFERYLAMTTDAKEYVAYQAILAEISSLLASSNADLSEKTLRHAWTRLYDAAEYPFDGDSCILIANCVYTSWRMKDEYNSFKREELDKIMEVKEAKWMLKSHSIYAENAQRLENEATSIKKVKSIGKSSNHSAEVAARVVELQEARAALLKSSSTKEVVATKAILQYQSQVVAFLMERKFQAAQLSAMFYRHIYRGNAQDIVVGKEELGKMLPVSQFTPNIDMIEGIANEARKDIRDGMNAVNSLYENGERFGALERLQETFILGESDPFLHTFDPEKRKNLHSIYKNLITVKKLSEVKDWDGIEKILEQLKIDAPDFPGTAILSQVRTAKRASDMHLLSAKQAAAAGDSEQVRASISESMKIWPLNPKLESFNNELVGLTMGTTIYIKKFDELFGRKDYRAIVAEAPEFGLALRQDEKRAKQLREVVIKVGRLDSLIEQAKEFQKQQSPYFAWDILENAKAIDAYDPVLARAQAALAPEVSDYVKALNEAKKAEDAGDYACALNYFLAAQQIFPASQTCRIGIERVAPRYAQ